MKDKIMPKFKHYPAVFFKDPDSDVGVMFPDFPGCVTAGENQDEAYEMAIEALQFHIDGMLEDGERLPEPSQLKKVDLKHRSSKSFQALALISVTIPTKAKRINITIDEGLLQNIDVAAAKRGMNRSAFLAEGAKNLLFS